MKFVVCVPDGCADLPVAELGGATPLEVASMPVLASLARTAELGRAAVIPEGMPPGSDVGNLSIFGYDPAEFHTGRAPIEAAALRLSLDEDEIAFRCNLVTTAGTKMLDFAGGHPASDLAAEAIERLNDALSDEQVRFHPGVQYRHIMTAPRGWLEAECVPPHDFTGRDAPWPSGPGATRLSQLMEASRAVLSAVDGLAANQIWLWGQGPMPRLKRFSDRFGVEAGLVTAVDLVRGLGVLADMDIVEVEGATGWYDTNYEGKRDAALATLEGGADLMIVHIEATDEAGHAGNVEEKVRALENWDRRVLAGLVDGLNSMGPWRMLMMPDHATPLSLRTHTPDPVPYLLYDREVPAAGGLYHERGVADMTTVPGHELMGRLIGARQ